MINDFIIDCETLGPTPNGVIVDFSITKFVDDHNNIPTFESLVNNAIRFKVSVKEQIVNYKRITSKSTLDWWSKQSTDAKLNIKPSSYDISLKSMVEGLKKYTEQHGDFKKSLIWSRGNSFDMSLLTTAIQQVYNTDYSYDYELVAFWNVRDIRTAIEQNLGRYNTSTPIRKGILNGFIKHDSKHDIAKDVIMYLYSKRYALGLEEIPKLHEVDPLTL